MTAEDSGNTHAFVFNIIKNELNSSAKMYHSGFYQSTNNYYDCYINLNSTGAVATIFRKNGSNISHTCKGYYR